MKLIEIGTRPAFMSGDALSFYVPQIWLSHHELEAKGSVYMQHRIGEELRYHTTDGPGRRHLTLRKRRGGSKSVLLTIPQDAVRDLEIVEYTMLDLSMMAGGALVVRRSDG